MRVCVAGLGHLGTITVACCSVVHDVIGFDFDAAAPAPIVDPGVPELLAQGRPAFTAEVAAAVDGADVVWIAYDTPVDPERGADVDWVLDRVDRIVDHVSVALVVVSAQLPVGTIRSLELRYPSRRFAVIPENLRVGAGAETFTNADRFVVGVRNDLDRDLLEQLLAPFERPIVWMSVESAEMTKHALNVFLATSVAYANEIATLCEAVGADAKEVERGLKTDTRIGHGAYLAPGGPFAGGTLARDVGYLRALGDTPLLDGVVASNDLHAEWLQRAVDRFDAGARVAVWGLAYKVGAATAANSSAIPLCELLVERGVVVTAHDPVVRSLTGLLADEVTLCASPLDAATDADAVVVTTPWPEYRDIRADDLVAAMRQPNVVDPSRLLLESLGTDSRVAYATVGAADGARA
jgi:UDPglucose 6-dehydrogenase